MSLQKLLTAIILSSGTLALSANASEIEKPYVGLDYTMLQIEDTGIDVEPHAIRVRGGSVLGKYLAVEAHAGAGVNSDTVSGTRVSLKSLYAVYLRPQVSLGALHLYALAGYGYLNIAVRDQFNGSYDEDDSDFTYGAGAQLDLGEKWGVNASYVQHMKDADYKVESLSAGVVYRF